MDAVQFCHQHQIAHRDLKPENIMLGPELTIKLTDFGLAQSISTELFFSRCHFDQFEKKSMEIGHQDQSSLSPYSRLYLTQVNLNLSSQTNVSL
ncbi:hypothetical protein EDC96DRAFT_511759 [Choanephora cucurbitarum]|nr:hypothetical protein EDC96DRAFT_511759 [Choanephora cucurbitarum]